MVSLSLEVFEERERRKEELVSWLYTFGIFIIVLLILSPFLQPFYSVLRFLGLVLFGLIVAFFSAYMLTPWTLRKYVKPFKDAPPEILSSLEELSRKAGLKKTPKLMVTETPEVNALTYASLFGPRICVTRGLLDAYQSGAIDRDELNAILGHEVGHVVNRDTLRFAFAISWADIFDKIGTMTTLMGIVTAAIGTVAGEVAGEEGEAQGVMIALFGWALFISGLILKIVAKIASLPAFHLSRKQEYAADMTGAELVHPEKMASALQKIEELNMRLAAEKLAVLPYTDRWQVKPRNPLWVEKLFDTHPPTEKRIANLRKTKILPLPPPPPPS